MQQAASVIDVSVREPGSRHVSHRLRVSPLYESLINGDFVSDDRVLVAGKYVQSLGRLSLCV